MIINGMLVRPLLLAIVMSLLVLSPAAAQNDDYFNLSIEQLANLQITSVARKKQRLSDAAAAVYVVTNEDIRRSGATTIAEALRLVPGLHVARIDAYRWAISSRGFTDVFANKLLIMIDGRTVYTPLFSGVFWDVQDTLIEDIERIEVIRGPGASLWGANAVNGVINVVTKAAKNTQGSYAAAGGGNIEQVFGETRWGGQAGDQTYYRGFFKYADRDGYDWEKPVPGDPRSGEAGWQTTRGGFRVDTYPNEQDMFTLQGDAFKVGEGQAIVFDQYLTPHMGDFPSQTYSYGADIIGRWTRTFSDTSDLQLQTYFDRVDRDDATSIHRASNFDIDFQHRFQPAEQHDFIWGAEFRHYQDATDRNFALSFNPSARSMDLYTWFLQDDITVVPDRFHAIVGSKFEHHAYTGFEFEPSIRGVWTPDETNSVWAAVSRAVRTPSRAERDIYLIATTIPPGEEAPLPVFVTGHGVESYDSEDLFAYELGYRKLAAENLNFDIAAFFNHYDNFRSARPLEPIFNLGENPYIELPFNPENTHRVDSNGVEVTADWQPWRWWRLVGTYSYLNVVMYGRGSTDPGILTGDDEAAPYHQISLRSLIDLPANVKLDSALRYVGETDTVSDYTELDLRLAWEPIKHLELSLVGHNLLQDEHVEWQESRFGEGQTAIERSVYAKAAWRF